MYASPPRPSVSARPTVLSKKLRDFSPAPGARIARTTDPSSTAFANTANSEPRKISVTSAALIGLRRSGLSLPYITIASSYAMRGNGGGVTVQSENSPKTPASTGSMAANTSSCVTKDSSTSS